MSDAMQQPSPAAGSQPEEKKNWFLRHKILTGLGALLLIGLIAGIGGGGEDSTGTANTDNQSAAEGKSGAKKDEAKKDDNKEAAKPGIGDTVRDGKFEFTVKDVKRRASVGTDFLKKTAQGEYVIITMDVKNTGDEPQTLDASSQKLANADGQEYSTTSDALFALEGAEKAFLEEINPGNSVKSVPLVFDVPKGMKLGSLTLHDSMFSGGVEVEVS